MATWIGIRGCCPWCDSEVETTPSPSLIHEDLQRAVEAMTLLHLTEPKAYHHDDE
jgi:hypothetical protein